MRVMIRHRIANLLLFAAWLSMEVARSLIAANEAALSDRYKPWLRYGEDKHD